MLLLICGAGASCDSVHRDDLNREKTQVDWRDQPPLAKDLFDAREPFVRTLANIPGAQPLVADMRNAVRRGEDVEEVLERIVAEAEGGHPHLYRQLMGLRYYLRQIIDHCTREWLSASSGATNYAALLSQLEMWRRPRDEPILLVTFNYDTLLESALAGGHYIYFNEMDDYIRRNDYKLLKLHGSTDWVRLFTLERALGSRVRLENWPSTIQYADRLKEAGVVERSGVRTTDTAAWVPAIAVPTRTKSHFQCPLEHLGALKDLLPDVHRLLVIGWRGQERHFMRVLKAHLSDTQIPALVVSGSREGSEEVCKNLEEVPPDPLYCYAD